MKHIGVFVVVFCFLRRFKGCYISSFQSFYSKRILDNDDDVSETIKKKRQKLQQASSFGSFSSW